jgi:hypothetical protein
MRAHDPPHDREAKPAPRAIAAAAIKALEDSLAVVRRHTITIVVDYEFAEPPIPARGNRDSMTSVMDCVIHQVACEFSQAPFVTIDDRTRRRSFEAYTLRRCHWFAVARATRNDRRKIDRLAMERATSRISRKRQ